MTEKTNVIRIEILVDVTNTSGLVSKEHGLMITKGTILEVEGGIPDPIARLIKLGAARTAIDPAPDDPVPDHLQDILARNAEDAIGQINETATAEDLQRLLELEAAGKNRKTVKEHIGAILADLRKPDPTLQDIALAIVEKDEEDAVGSIADDMSEELLRVIMSAEQSGKNRTAVMQRIAVIMGSRTKPE